MNRKKFLALVLSAIMLLSAMPVLANDTVTREYVINEFAKAAGIVSDKEPQTLLEGFADYEEISPSCVQSVAYALDNGIITGYEDNTLRPQKEISRLEALVILSRCLKDTEKIRENEAFTDVPQWAEESISRLYMGGIVNGYGNGRLGSDDKITAEQVSLLTERITSAEKKDGISEKDNFYLAVNKDYLENTEIPEDELSVSELSKVAKEVEKRVLGISNELYANYDTLTRSNFTTIEGEAAKFYSMALDYYSQKGDNGLAELRSIMTGLYRGSSLTELSAAAGNLSRSYGIPVMFDFYVLYRTTDNGYRTLGGKTLEAIGAGISRETWEEGGEQEFANYCKYLETVFTLLGTIRNPKELAKNVGEYMRAVDLAATEISEDSEEEENTTYTYRDLRYRYTSNNLDSDHCNPVLAIYRTLDKEYFEAVPSSVYEKELEFTIPDIAQVDASVEMLRKLDFETIQGICIINFLEGIMTYLPEAYRQAYSDYYSLFDNTLSTPREYATSVTQSLYGAYYEKRYLELYPAPDTESISALIEEIISCFEEKISGAKDIYSPSTIANAQRKLNKIEYGVAEPRRDYDEITKEGSYYIVNQQSTFLKTIMNILSKSGGNVTAIYTPVKMQMECYEVNASYNRYENSFNVYSGILSEPIYSSTQSREEVLAGIGFTIAHEISHAFDKDGSRFDYLGEPKDWWTEADYERYEARADKIAKVFGEYVMSNGKSVDPDLTADENIADVLAMSCIIEIAKKENLDLDKLFRAYAKNWAEVYTDEYMDYLLERDEHSPGEVRVNAVLANFDEFYEVYGISEGDGMYRAPEKRIKIF